MTFDPKDAIDVANAQSIDDFIQCYISTGNEWKTWTHPLTKEEYQIECQKAEDLSKEQLDACFELIKFTSLDHYKKSKDGWKPRKKMNEMKLLDLKYLFVKREDQVEGFISIMPTYEDEYPVIYIYEIHLSESIQGTGLGGLLMSHVEAIASKVPSVEKIMLTCFLANERAVKFYEKVGFTKDEFSPPPKQLRNGALVEADYVILSKAVKSAT